MTTVILAGFGALAALSGSTLANFKPFGKTLFDLYDFATSNLLLPLGGVFICLFVGWRWARSEVVATLSNEGSLGNRRFIALFLALVKFVTPVLVFVVLLNGLGVIKLWTKRDPASCRVPTVYSPITFTSTRFRLPPSNSP